MTKKLFSPKRLLSIFLALVLMTTLFSPYTTISAEGEVTMTANKTHIYAGETVKVTFANLPDGAFFACFPGNQNGNITKYEVSGYQKLTSSSTSASYKFTSSGYYVLAIWNGSWNFLQKIPIVVDAAPTISVNTTSVTAGGTFVFTFSGITDASTTFGLLPCDENGNITTWGVVSYGYSTPAAGTVSQSVTVSTEGYYLAAIWGPGWDFVAKTVVSVGSEGVVENPEMTVDNTVIEAGDTLHFTLSNVWTDVEFGLLAADANGNISEPKTICNSSYKKLSTGTTEHSLTVTTAGSYVAAIWGSGWNFYVKIPITVTALPDAAVHQTVYVDSVSGSDSNDGSAQAPKATLAAAVNSITTVNGTVVINDQAVYESQDITPRTGAVTIKGATADSLLIYGTNGIVLQSNTALSSLSIKQTAQSGCISANGYSLTTDENVSFIGNGSTQPVFTVTHADGSTTALNDIGCADITIGTNSSGEVALAINGKNGYQTVEINDSGAAIVEDEHALVNDGLSSTEYLYTDYADYINYRKPLTNTYQKLTQDKEIKILYLGGSVTAGYGGNIGGWRGLSMGWFRSNFPDADITFVNTAIGESGTFLGTYRIQSDVIAQQPDLMFIEYAINDTYKGSTKEQAALQYETVVREVKAALPDCDIVTLLVTDRTRYSADGLYPTAAGHEEIAQKYNISTVNVGAALVESMTNYLDDSEWYDYFLDGVHPLNKGYEAYFECLQEYLRNTLLYTNYTAIQSNRDVLLPVQSASLLDGNRVSKFGTDIADIITESQGFSYSEEIFHSTGDTPHYGYYYTQSGTDASITFSFSGTEFAFWTNFYNTSSVKYSIDGGDFITDYYCDRHAPTQVITGLTAGTHTITIVPVTYGSESSNVFKIGAVFTRDETAQSLQGKTVAYNDGINRISFTVPTTANAIYYLPETAMVGDLPVSTATGTLFKGWKNTNGEYIAAKTLLCDTLPLTAEYAQWSSGDFGVTDAHIRATKKIGLRFIIQRSADFDTLLQGIDGDFEYGYLVLPQAYINNGNTLTVDNTAAVQGSSAMSGFKHYYEDNKAAYSVCVTGIVEERYTADYTVCGFVRYTDCNGVERVIYSEAYSCSLYNAAKNTDTSTLTTAEAERIQAVINSVEEK